MSGTNDIREAVRERYGALAEGSERSCCGTSCCSTDAKDTKGADALGYTAEQLAAIPEGSNLGLGCGNPLAHAGVKPGETVLDLGSGAGIDAFLASREVGAEGRVIGVDMTPSMVTRARENAAKGGYRNVEFRLGEIENLPVADASVDVIISNCVINLSADKARVIREAHRVLNPGGRFAVSDVVLRGNLPEPVLRSVGLWTACVSGALHEDEYRRLLLAAGFTDVSIEPTRIYSSEDVQALLDSAGLEDPGLVPALEGNIISAFVRATKPPA